MGVIIEPMPIDTEVSDVVVPMRPFRVEIVPLFPAVESLPDKNWAIMFPAVS